MSKWKHNRTVAERLDDMSMESVSGCIVWLGSEYDFGHGQLRIDGKLQRAHRLAWEDVNGPVPDGLCVLHKCDVPQCINPEHLFLGTKKDNSIDMARKGRVRGGPKPKGDF